MELDNNRILIKNLINGEEKAYIFLLNKFHRQLYAYALTLINNQAMAQDIVQNVFFKTWKNRKKLNPEYSIQSFLYKCVYNEFINTYQKNQTSMLYHQKYIESAQDIADGSDDNDLGRLIRIVNKEINNLPPKCQSIFLLSKKDGLTNYEISEYLNISVKTVEAHITKAFSILKRKLS